MFQDKKTTQMAARLLRQASNKLPYIVLLKMIYLADKQMLLQYGEPITFDKWVSMENGPLPSHVYDLIKYPELSAFWSTHIKTAGYNVILDGEPGDGALSELEEEVIDAIFAEYHDKTGKYDESYIWNLVKQTHELPEWDKRRGIYGGVSNISYEQVLSLAGLDAQTIEDILDNIEGRNVSALMLSEVA